MAKMEEWLRFLKDPEKEYDTDSEEIKQSRKALEEVCRAEEKRIRTKIIENYKRNLYEKMKEGYCEGLKAGRVCRLLKLGLTVEQIMEKTGLTKEEIEEIKEIEELKNSNQFKKQ